MVSVLSIAKILNSQVVFMGYMLKALARSLVPHGLTRQYCSNQPVLLYIPGGGGYIVYYTRYPEGGQMLLGW